MLDTCAEDHVAGYVQPWATKTSDRVASSSAPQNVSSASNQVPNEYSIGIYRAPRNCYEHGFEPGTFNVEEMGIKNNPCIFLWKNNFATQ